MGKQPDREGLDCLMATCMKDNLATTWPMERVFYNVTMEAATKEHGGMICSMEQEWNTGQTAASMKVDIIVEKNTVMAGMYGQIKVNIVVTGKAIACLALDAWYGMMVGGMTVNG